MELDRRALYNLIRMNWLNEASANVESWQVEDYRNLPLKVIFERLEILGLFLDQTSFYAFSGPIDTPEELTDELIQEADLPAGMEDEIYLLVFELWRRLIPEKQCLTVFCDELDHQIFRYDRENVEDDEPIQDVIAHLQMILDENTDKGEKPEKVFEAICFGCANDLESFLYDFIAMQIDDNKDLYASELTDGLESYVKGSKWFEILRLRLLADSDEHAAEDELKKVVLKAVKSEDLQYNLEILSLIAQIGERKEFAKMVKKAIPLLEVEQDLQDLLDVCRDFYRYHDLDTEEQSIQSLIKLRDDRSSENSIDQKDPYFPKLLKIISK